jgi:hypothetical protein
LARATGGGVDYWMGLPISELMAWLNELVKQLRDEQDQIEGG